MYFTYVPKYWGGLRVLDINDPANPVDVSFTVTARFAVDVITIDTLAYVLDGYSGLWIIDVTDPARPNKLGNINFGGKFDRPGDLG